jgi:Phage tail lysozyme
MAINAAAVAYCAVGGLIAYSGIKGATLTDTAKSVLSGNLSVTDTETIDTSGGSSGTGTAGNAPAGPATSGDQVQNGTTIYTYLRKTGGYTPMQAAGTIASIWGESGWDPESSGTGGRGLIAWTPPSKLPNSAFTGNAAKDMSAQLPLILDFVAENGDTLYVAQMANAGTIDEAAEIWGQKVERYGIDDVHSTGIQLAAQIAKSVDNVSLPTGL